MVACTAEATARSGAECFDRPLPRKLSGFAGRTSLLHHFPALRAGLLSLGSDVFVSDESNVFFVCFDTVGLDTAKTNNE
jgi:hypothetical protein